MDSIMVLFDKIGLYSKKFFYDFLYISCILRVYQRVRGGNVDEPRNCSATWDEKKIINAYEENSTDHYIK